MDRLFIKTLFVSAFFLPFSASLANDNSTITKTLNPYIPHVYISGYGGTFDGNGDTLGRADILAPAYLQNDRNLFIYAQGRVSDGSVLNNEIINNSSTPWQGTGGIGYRQIFNLSQ